MKVTNRQSEPMGFLCLRAALTDANGVCFDRANQRAACCYVGVRLMNYVMTKSSIAVHLIADGMSSFMFRLIQFYNLSNATACFQP